MGPEDEACELNPRHDLISRINVRLAANSDDPFLPDASEVLLGLALLSEASELADPVRFNRAAAEVLSHAL